MAKKWEYKVIGLDFQTDQEGLLHEVAKDDLGEGLLNALGQEGWELIAIAAYVGEGNWSGGQTGAYLKREAS